jgi:hypothetical protein
VVVTGVDCHKIRRELSETSAIIVENKNWRSGIGSSIRTGIESLIDKVPNLAAVVLLVCGQPGVTGHTIEELIVARKETGKAIIASSYSDTLGAPALFRKARSISTLWPTGRNSNPNCFLTCLHQPVCEGHCMKTLRRGEVMDTRTIEIDSGRTTKRIIPHVQ